MPPSPPCAFSHSHHEAERVDRQSRRRVVQRAVLGVHRVVQHRVQRLGRAREQVLADDHERHARRPEVLLRAGVDEPVLETSIGRLKMSDEASLTSGALADVGQRLPLRALDGVVRGDVHVGRAGGEAALLRRGECG